MLIYAYLPFFVLSRALIQSEIVRSQVIIAKCSKLQVDTIKVEVKEIRIIPKADVNGALNIMRKSSVVDVNILYSRGEVDTPIRIRIA